MLLGTPDIELTFHLVQLVWQLGQVSPRTGVYIYTGSFHKQSFRNILVLSKVIMVPKQLLLIDLHD